VKTEAAEALASGKLVPALIDDVAPPMEFKRIQAANLSHWTGDGEDPEYRGLIGSVERMLRQAPGAARPVPHDVRSRWSGGRRGRPVVWVAVAIVAVLSAWTVFNAFSNRDGSTPASSPPPPTAGVPEAAPVPSSPSARSGNGRVNLLAADAGGEMVLASSEGWLKTIDGEPDTAHYGQAGEQAVFAFRDGRPATFDTFASFIPATSHANVREFELFSGNDSATGRFDSIAVVVTENVRIIRKPFQEFQLPRVTAKFVKIRALKPHDNLGVIQINELALFGRVE
jgi:hypothetical protein